MRKSVQMWRRRRFWTGVAATACLAGLAVTSFDRPDPVRAAVFAVSGVTSSATNGYLKLGSSAITISVTFTGSVTPTYTTGTKPYLLLETGSTDREAFITSSSGSATSTLNFSYTVQAGDVSSDLDYVDTTSLVLNGGTIKNGTDNADLTLPAPGAAGSLGANKALVVDGVVPTIVGVTSTKAPGWYGLNDVIDIDIEFSEPVTTSSSTLTLETGPSDGYASYVSGSGTNVLRYNYTVGAGHKATDLDYVATSSLSGSISDAALNYSLRVLPAPGAAGSLAANAQIGILHFTFTNPQTNGDTGIARDPASGIFFLDSGGTGINQVTADTLTMSTWLSDGNYPEDFQVVGSYLYWSGSSAIYRSLISSPGRSLVATSTGVGITAFTRIGGANYVVNATNRTIYRLTDGSSSPTAVATLPSTATGVYAIYPGAEPDHLLALDGIEDFVYDVDLTAGTSSVHADLNKCAYAAGTSNPGVRGMTRTADGTEYYGFYTASQSFARRTVDGSIACATLRDSAGTSSSLRAAFAMTADASALYTVTSVDNMGVQSGFIRMVPNFPWGGAEVLFADSGDVVGPFALSAVVGGTRSTIQVTMSEALASAAGAIPTASEFQVQADGVGATVSGVSISGVGVTLTLASPVTSGAAVSVAYADPTTADDAAALQDGAGNDAAGFSLWASFAATAPSLLDLLAADDTGSSSSDNTTKLTTLRIGGSAPSGASVQLYVDGVATGSACSESGGSFSCTTGVLAEGSRSITARSTVSSVTSSDSNALTVVVDTTAPAAPTSLALAALSDTGVSSTDRLTNDTTPTVEGTTEANAVVQLSVDGTPSGSTCAANGSGQFSCTASPVSEASHNVTAVATDVAGNSSAASASLSVDVDITSVVLPSSMMGSLTCRPTWCDSDYISSTATPSFVASAPNDTYAQLYISGTATGSLCTTTNGASAGTFTCTTATLANGNYSVTAKLYDLAGNESTSGYSARAFRVTSGYVPTTTVAPTTTTSSTTTSTVASSPSTTVAPTTSAPAATTTTTIAAQTGSGRLVWYANSTSGSDSSGNGSETLPFATFHRAYSAARAGDIIDLTGTFTWTDSDESGDAVGAGYRIAKNLTIRGQGANRTIVQAANRENAADRAVFTTSATVTIRDLTIRHGKVTGGGMAGGVINRSRLTLESVTISDNRSVTASQYSFYTAGGVFTDSNTTLVMDKVTVRDNICDCIVYAAGGVYALQSANKTISNSTFVGNRAAASRIGPYPFSYASAAGAFNTFRFGFTEISNSTFYGNTSADYGGAMNIYYQNYANLTNLTIVGNEAGLGAGGILYRSEWDGYNLNMKNVLLANNTAAGEPNDFHAFNSASASRMTSSHNIVEASTNKTFDGVGEITGQQASLDFAAALAPNGSRNGTDTLLIGPGSVAKDAGDGSAHGGRVRATPASTDQRGVGRVGPVDIGAVENQSESNSVAIAETTTTSSSTTTTLARSTTTSQPETVTTQQGERQRNVGTSTTVATEVTINPEIVATTVPTASTIPIDDAEDLTVESTTETEIKASNDSVEIVLSIVDKSFAELVQGRTGRLVAKQGLYAKVRGKGFLAGSLAEVWVFSSPRLLAHLQVSSKGEAAGYVLIPEDLELGDHRVELRGSSSRRRVVKATIPLTVLDDGAPASTVLPTPEEVMTAITLPTQSPAIIVPAPVDGMISIGDDVIRSVLTDVLGGSMDLSKIRLRLRVNKGSWQVVDTSSGDVIAVVLPSQSGENEVEFEVTDEEGRTVVVQRQVYVEGSPQAVAYAANVASGPDSAGSVRRWIILLVVALGAVYLIGVGTRRRKKGETTRSS